MSLLGSNAFGTREKPMQSGCATGQSTFAKPMMSMSVRRAREVKRKQAKDADKQKITALEWRLQLAQNELRAWEAWWQQQWSSYSAKVVEEPVPQGKETKKRWYGYGEIEVPQVQTVKEIFEAPQIQPFKKVVPVSQVSDQEQRDPMTRAVTQQVVKHDPVPKAADVGKIVETPQVQILERVVPVPQVTVQEMPRQGPRVMPQAVAKQVLVPQAQTVEKVAQVLQLQQADNASSSAGASQRQREEHQHQRREEAEGQRHAEAKRRAKAEIEEIDRILREAREKGEPVCTSDLLLAELNAGGGQAGHGDRRGNPSSRWQFLKGKQPKKLQKSRKQATGTDDGEPVEQMVEVPQTQTTERPQMDAGLPNSRGQPRFTFIASLREHYGRKFSLRCDYCNQSMDPDDGAWLCTNCNSCLVHAESFACCKNKHLAEHAKVCSEKKRGVYLVENLIASEKQWIAESRRNADFRNSDASSAGAKSGGGQTRH